MTDNNNLSLDFQFIAPRKKAIIIGQAPPKNIDNIPFKKTRLYKWLSEINISQAEAISIFEFEALINFFPGSGKKGDNIPSDNDIQKHIPVILKKIESNDIDLVIPVGKMAIEYVLGIENVKLSEVIGNCYHCSIFRIKSTKLYIIPLPHPSGLSTWSFKEDHHILLKRALANIQNHFK